MGNCLSSQGADDLSLLNESEGASLPGEPPPPYQVKHSLLDHNTVILLCTTQARLQTSSDCVPYVRVVIAMAMQLSDLDLKKEQEKFAVGRF